MMDKQTDTEHRPSIEAGLEMLFTAPTPEPAFIIQVEQRLLARAGELADQPLVGEPAAHRVWGRLLQPFARHQWATAVIGLLLALAVVLAATGPQRAWAELQRLLGYAPGVGFVNLKETRVLTAPVEVTRDGVTLRVEQVLAGPDKTTVVIRSEGLPPEEELWPENRREGTGDLQARLRLPDGSALTTKALTLRPGGGTLDFPPLPDDIYRATLELPRLPLVPAGAAPEGWTIPLTLHPATGELVAELYPQPYAPADASDTHHGITVAGLDVVHGSEETLLRVQVRWSSPEWKFALGIDGGDRRPILRDDLGHVYGPVTPSNRGPIAREEVERIPPTAMPVPPSSVLTHEETVAFAAVSPSARRLTLEIEGLRLETPAEGQFSIDLGDNPQIGEYWSLDVHLTVAGFPVHVTGVRLEEKDDPDIPYQLTFDIAPVPDQPGRALRGISFTTPLGSARGWGGGYSWPAHRLKASISFDALPAGSIPVEVHHAEILVRGPWIISWAVPDADAAGDMQISPVTLNPANASQTRAGLTLRATEVTRTDRLTAVTIELDDALPNVTLNRVLRGHPLTDTDGLYLEDDRGRRYAVIPWGLDWQPPGEQTPRTFGFSETLKVSERLIFEPLQPLARRVTLHVPAVEITQAGPAAFDVVVPAGVKVQPRAESASWLVDIPIEVAGYRVHFTEARLEERSGTIMLVLTSAPLEHPRGDRQLTGLQPGAVTAPDGRSVNLDSAFGVAGPEYRSGDEVNGPCRMRLAFDVTDPETHLVQPGRYHVKLAGAIVAVEGPWALSWNLGAP